MCCLKGYYQGKTNKIKGCKFKINFAKENATHLGLYIQSILDQQMLHFKLTRIYQWDQAYLINILVANDNFRKNIANYPANHKINKSPFQKYNALIKVEPVWFTC